MAGKEATPPPWPKSLQVSVDIVGFTAVARLTRRGVKPLVSLFGQPHDLDRARHGLTADVDRGPGEYSHRPRPDAAVSVPVGVPGVLPEKTTDQSLTCIDGTLPEGPVTVPLGESAQVNDYIVGFMAAATGTS